MAAVTFDSYEAASDALASQVEKMVVSGTLLPGPLPPGLQPGDPLPPELCRYFLVPEDATPEQVRDKAFEVRTGRKMEPYEKFLLDQAEADRRLKENR